MTPEKQRIAIAEACGWAKSRFDNSEWAHPDGSPDNTLPDYLNDFNAMHEAVMAQGLAHDWGFEEKLAEVCKVGDASTDWWEASAYRNRLIHATAAEWAEAFLRALNLWTD